jgi:5,10-methylenetetrahydromethanopterin reductase
MTGSSRAMILGTAAHPFRPFDEWLRIARLVEELGYGMTCQSQNPLLRGDPFVELGAAALVTRNVLLATMVAVPIAPNPATMAASAATLDNISGGRAVLGLGRGTATAKACGEAAMSTGVLEAYVIALRALLRGNKAVWKGTELRMEWVTRPVPVILSAYGVRTLELAGRHADGVLIGSATRGPALTNAIEIVRRSATDAGRDPSDIALWVVARVSLKDDRSEALNDIKGILAASALQLSENDPDLDDDLRSALSELKARYVYKDHVVPGGANDQLVEELGLVDYLAGRFSISGTPVDCRNQFQQLADAGVDCVFLNGAIKDDEGMITSVAEKVGVRFERSATAPPA